jgi:hypothetical protein
MEERCYRNIPYLWRVIFSGNTVAVLDPSGVWLSVNAGTTFVKSTTVDQSWNTISISSYGGNLIAAGYDGAIYRGNVVAGTFSGWARVNGAPTSARWTAVTSDSTGTNLAAVMYGGNVWTSNDSGTTWLYDKQKFYYINGVYFPNSLIIDLRFDFNDISYNGTSYNLLNWANNTYNYLLYKITDATYSSNQAISSISKLGSGSLIGIDTTYPNSVTRYYCINQNVNLTLPTSVVGNGFSVSYWAQGISGLGGGSPETHIQISDSTNNNGSVSANTNNFLIFGYNANGYIYFNFWDVVSQHYWFNYSTSSSHNYFDGLWHHIVAVISFPSNNNVSVSIYIDGNLVTTSSNQYYHSFTVTQIKLGSVLGANTGPFEGYIDQFKLFYSPLSSTQITTLFNDNNNNYTTVINSCSTNLNWSSVVMNQNGSQIIASEIGGSIWIGKYVSQGWTGVGYSWFKSPNTSKNWISVACNASGTTLVAAVEHGGIWTSYDAGVSWKQNPDVNIKYNYWRSVACNSYGNIMFASEYGGKIWISSDAGRTWNPYINQTNLPNNASWLPIACNGYGDLVYVGNYGASGMSPVAFGSYQGHSWKLTLTAFNATSTNSTGNKVAVVTNNNGIVVSGDSGATWRVGSGTTNANFLSVDSTVDGSKYVANSANSVYISSDAGSSWNVTSGAVSGGGLSQIIGDASLKSIDRIYPKEWTVFVSGFGKFVDT